MAIPPQLIMAAAQMIKNRKSTKDRIKEALAPATDVLKNTIAPLVGMGADAGMMYNLRAEDPSMRTGIATGAIGSAAKGFQSNGITGLLTGGIMGGLTGAIATGNAKEQKAEADKYTYLNQMYGSVVGADTNLQSALMYAEDGGEIVSAEGEVFVPIQTEAKRIGKKLVKEKFIFSDGKIADVNATKPHSEQKKDDVTDITVEGTYVMPVSTKLNKKDLDSLISYSTSNYSENGKNFAVDKVTVRDILGKNFEGSFAEATDIVVKKYPVMDSEDDLDPIARITNNENIANRSKIIAHLMRLNEAKINKDPIEEVKLTPSMKAKKGGYIQKYVLGSTVVSDPPKKKRKDSEYLELKDERKIRSTTGLPIDPNTDLLSGKYKKDTINDIIYYAKKHDVDPYTALAVGLQETGLGTSDRNIGHTIGDQDVERGENEIEDFVKVLKYKTSDYAKKQGVPDDDEERRLQAYNGYGNVNAATEEDYHGFKMRKIYGVPIPKEGINMKDNPLYGRQIIDIRENVIKNNKTIGELIKTVQNSSKARTLSTETVGNKEIDRFIDFKSNTADTRVFELEEPIITSKIDFKNNKVKNTVETFKSGGFISKYVLKPKMIAKQGGYIRKMEDGGNVGDPPGKTYKDKKGNTIIVGNDKKVYWKDKSGKIKEADPRIVDAFNKDMENKGASGPASSWRLLEESTPKNNTKNVVRDNKYEEQYLYWKGNSSNDPEVIKKDIDRIEANKKNNILVIRGRESESEAIYNAYKDKYKELTNRPKSSTSNVSNNNTGDDKWISRILDFESTAGSQSGTGLKNYGIKRDKWGKKYSYLDKDEISREDATRFIKEEYLSKVKDYPPDVQKRLVDYAYNTGRNIEDVLMHASGLVDTESVQTKNTDYDLFEKNKAQIIKNMEDPNFVSKIDKSKHDILKDYWTRKGTPEAYDDTSSKRIDMWNRENDANVSAIDNSNIDPINSMQSMDILGAPVIRPNAPASISVSGASKNGKNWSIGPLGEKPMDWELGTPVDGYGDYVKSKMEQTAGAKTVGANPNYNTPDDNEIDPKYLNESGTTTTSKYTPKGGYYIPGENKNRYDKDAEGNWYVQKEDGKTWVPASSLPNSAEAIKKLNDESKAWNGGTQNKRLASSSSLVKTKANTPYNASSSNTVSNTAQNTETSTNEVTDKSSQDKKGNYTYDVFISDPWLKNYDTPRYQEDLATRIDAGIISPEEAKRIQEAAKKKGYHKPIPKFITPKMKKGGYIKKMNAGGPIVPMPIYPNPNTGIYAMYDPSIPYQEMEGILPDNNNGIFQVLDPNRFLPPSTTTVDPNLRKTSSIPPDDSEVDPKYLNPSQAKGLTPTDPSSNTPNTGQDDVLEMYRNKISERKGDAVRDAEEAKLGYKALSKRVGMRDLMQLGTGLVGIGLQDRTEKRAFKRPLYIDQKYRGLSAQQINQQAEASTGAGVEAIKQMMNGGGDRVTARLAPVLIDRLMSQQGQTRKAYVDQNTSLERAKYAERGTIQQFNLDEDARAKNVERDFNNKAIGDSTSLINKYISSRSTGDIEGYKTMKGIEEDKTKKIYSLENQEMQVDMIGKDYDMQITDVKKRISDIEAELTNPNVNLDETAKASLKSYQDSYKKMLEDLEKRKIRQNINGQ